MTYIIKYNKCLKIYINNIKGLFNNIYLNINNFNLVCSINKIIIYIIKNKFYNF